MDENGDSGGFLYFIILIAIYLLSFLKNRAKKKKQQEQAPPQVLRAPVKDLSPPRKEKPLPSIAMATTTSKKEEEEVITPMRSKGKPRIVKLVEGLHSKKELILISEILKPCE